MLLKDFLRRIDYLMELTKVLKGLSVNDTQLKNGNLVYEMVYSKKLIGILRGYMEGEKDGGTYIEGVAVKNMNEVLSYFAGVLNARLSLISFDNLIWDDLSFSNLIECRYSDIGDGTFKRKTEMRHSEVYMRSKGIGIGMIFLNFFSIFLLCSSVYKGMGINTSIPYLDVAIRIVLILICFLYFFLCISGVLSYVIDLVYLMFPVLRGSHIFSFLCSLASDECKEIASKEFKKDLVSCNRMERNLRWLDEMMRDRSKGECVDLCMIKRGIDGSTGESYMGYLVDIELWREGLITEGNP